MWITPRSRGRLFNESTGRGQQLVACVWAGRIRPLALGSPAPPSSSLPRFPHLLTHPFIQPSSPFSPPQRMKSFVRSTTARPGVGPEPRGPSGQPAPEPEQNQVEPLTALAAACLHRPTQVPKPPVLGRGKRKMSKTERDINRTVGQYQWERRTAGKTQRTVAKTQKGGHFTLKSCSRKMSYSEWEKKNLQLNWTKEQMIVLQTHKYIYYIIKSVDLFTKEQYSICIMTR